MCVQINMFFKSKMIDSKRKKRNEYEHFKKVSFFDLRIREYRKFPGFKVKEKVPERFGTRK
jgi:hypothetical protein